ncbi:MAG: YkgJ family cysteine cluster protein [Planctomycetes bacterium]|nr:YkgJ family cysteine cluster protein [Planctomycetota bacterium]MCG2684248.1 YkgJ family cysteine cluster protein [Planctomycetales bacterium]
MEMQTIVDDWKANAEWHDDRNFAFLRSLKMKDDRAVDRAARQLHEEVFAVIDCTQCANCCKTVSPLFSKADIRRIAKRLGMTATDFRTTYLQTDEDGDLHLKSRPCPFLAEDGRCTVYEARPRDCAEYPHTQKKGFSGRTHLHAGNALHCPAVFWIVEQLRARRLRH